MQVHLKRVAFRRRFSRIGLIGALVFAGALALGWRLAVHPPDASLSAMERTFQILNDEEGSRYAPLLTNRAEAVRRSAIARWQSEDKRLFFIRDYDEVDTLARKAEALASQGIARSRVARDSIRGRTEVELALLHARIDEITTRLDRLPQIRSLKQQILDARSRLITLENRRRDGDLLESAAALKQAASVLKQAGVELDRLIAEYFDGIPQWKRWAAETVAWSKTHRAVALVIDKMAHACYVYSNGKLVATFDVDLGPQWVGPKRHEGDLSTPEGKYHIKRKRGPGETDYYLALEIDYPNDEDRIWFERARRAGVLPKGVRLGGNIELHGNGGRTFNWTKGCVALTNSDMKTVFDMVEVGTPVTILGALEHPFPVAGGPGTPTRGEAEPLSGSLPVDR